MGQSLPYDLQVVHWNKHSSGFCPPRINEPLVVTKTTNPAQGLADKVLRALPRLTAVVQPMLFTRSAAYKFAPEANRPRAAHFFRGDHDHHQ